MKRRLFLKTSLISALMPRILLGQIDKMTRSKTPLVISTWQHGLAANEAAMKVLREGGSALDAVETGVRVPEGDPNVPSVGYGGTPDEDGHVTLDACIMNSKGDAGAVAFLQNIKHPISVARKVMERSDHVFLVGEGALRFARAHGFKEENLLTDAARKKWLHWKETFSDKDDWGPQENHDTISLLAQDRNGDLAGACTTSGLSFKIHGRVGDSPIIGAGLYVDNDVGAAGATGRGEAVIKTAGSFLVVEYMRQGYDPSAACEAALKRIIKQHNGNPNFNVAYVALRKDGVYGFGAIWDGFKYALFNGNENRLHMVKGIISN
jgi:isoaspartyl peptidase/L-asparaginase-like protein (Ntn-hydrolase superfamily)